MNGTKSRSRTRPFVHLMLRANLEGLKVGAHQCGSEELLLALIGQEGSLVAKLLERAGLGLEETRAAIKEISSCDRSYLDRMMSSFKRNGSTLPKTANFNFIIAQAADEAYARGSDVAEYEHVFLALLRLEDSGADRVFQYFGLERELLYRRMLKRMGEQDEYLEDMDSSSFTADPKPGWSRRIFSLGISAALFLSIFFHVMNGFMQTSQSLYGPADPSAKASVLWPSTEGVIEKFDVIEVRAPHHYFQPAPTYVYSVAGTKYSGSTVYFSGPRCLDSLDAHIYLNRYHIGQAIRVYYDPKDPSKCCLQTGSKH